MKEKYFYGKVRKGSSQKNMKVVTIPTKKEIEVGQWVKVTEVTEAEKEFLSKFRS